MKAVLFGGSGFLGSHVADALSRAGHEVTVYDLRPSPWLRHDQEMVVGDILDDAAVRRALDGCEVALNFAGIADLDNATTRPMDTVLQNVLGNAAILQGCVAAGVRRYVYASTVYVYSDKGGFYRCSKQAAETYVEEFQRRHGLDFTVLRFGTLYGPRSDGRNSIHRYLHQALTEGRIETSGTGEERRDYIHVRDAARLVVEVLGPDFANTHVTLTGQHTMRFRDLLTTIREIMNRRVEVVYGPGAGSGSAHYDITPYSYSPKVGVKLTSTCYTDLGQGLLECLEEIDGQLRKAPGEGIVEVDLGPCGLPHGPVLGCWNAAR